MISKERVAIATVWVIHRACQGCEINFTPQCTTASSVRFCLCVYVLTTKINLYLLLHNCSMILYTVSVSLFMRVLLQRRDLLYFIWAGLSSFYFSLMYGNLFVYFSSADGLKCASLSPSSLLFSCHRSSIWALSVLVSVFPSSSSFFPLSSYSYTLFFSSLSSQRAFLWFLRAVFFLLFLSLSYLCESVFCTKLNQAMNLTPTFQ